MTAGTSDARTEMNAMYRFTRHVYDFSRKYYLLGRDKLVEGLKACKGENVCEIGCGTARNLIKMHKFYPTSNLYGIDASDEMLKTAVKKIEGKDIHLAQTYAQTFNPESVFGVKKFDKIVFSYALSIIPPWKESIDHALTLLPSGGEMHIVDFGDQADLPEWFRKFLFWWLKLFHVYHKPEILNHLKELEKKDKGRLEVKYLYKRYAYLAKFVRA